MGTKLIALITVAILTLRAGFQSQKARDNLLELLSKKKWIVNLLLIIGFIAYIIYSTKDDDSDDAKKTQEALKKAIIAFIIALFAELGLTIAPFWWVFVLAYYMEGWI